VQQRTERQAVTPAAAEVCYINALQSSLHHHCQHPSKATETIQKVRGNHTVL